MFFRILAHADIPNGCVTRIPSVLSSGLSMISIGKLTPIFPQSIELNPCTDLLRQRLSRSSGTVRDQPLCEAFRD